MWNQQQLISLPRSQVDNAGLYTCLAESPAGEVEKSFRVRVQGRWCGNRGRGSDMGPARVGPPSLISSYPQPLQMLLGPGVRALWLAWLQGS